MALSLTIASTLTPVGPDMPRSFIAFALATMLPLPFLLAGALFGGVASWVALAYMTIGIAAVDAVMPQMSYDGAAAEEDEADLLSQILAAFHGVVLLVTIWSLAGGGPGLFSVSGVAQFLASVLFFGQVSLSNAHGLIHRPAKMLQYTGRAIYASVLMGHHPAAHLGVHHSLLATPEDPGTAQAGESYYRFAPRAWLGAFKAGLVAERKRLNRAALPRHHWSNSYVQGAVGGGIMLVVSLILGGFSGVLVFVILSASIQALSVLSDYVRHYGLLRAEGQNGGYTSVNQTHSWNGTQWLSSLWMLNAPRTSDHAVHPARVFSQRELPARGTAPTLPYSLPVMTAIALHPPLFHRVMQPHVEAWRPV